MRGAAFGFAVGDAMGAATEFMTAEEIKRKHGRVTEMIGGGWLDVRPGEVTDDTQMTMCVMRALEAEHRKPFVFKMRVADEFAAWYETRPKDVGGACAAGIRHYMETGEYVESDPSTLGNGALMRSMPCALIGLDGFNALQAAVTHNNETQSRLIESYSKALRGLIRDTYKPRKSIRLQNPSGHVENTLNNALYWTRSVDFETAIIGAVNDGGDADTIAAVTGSLAGARFGYGAIPKQWVDALDPEIQDELEKFVEFAISYCNIYNNKLY